MKSKKMLNKKFLSMFKVDAPIDKVINKLQDDSHYYGDYGRQFLSNSDINKLLYSPNEFRKPTPKTKELVMGSYFHTAMLEPDKLKNYEIIEASSRSTKIYKENVPEGEFYLLQKEAEQVMVWVDKMKSNLQMFDYIYSENNQYEIPGVTQIMGNWWKGKADILTDEFIIDIKTTTKVHDFKWKCNTYNYDSQAYIYQRLFNRQMIFFVIDKDTLQLKICDCSPEFIERGKEKVEKATHEYNSFYGENKTKDPENFVIQETL